MNNHYISLIIVKLTNWRNCLETIEALNFRKKKYYDLEERRTKSRILKIVRRKKV